MEDRLENAKDFSKLDKDGRDAVKSILDKEIQIFFHSKLLIIQKIASANTKEELLPLCKLLENLASNSASFEPVSDSTHITT